MRRKARLVAQGFRQKEGIDFTETYALVARMTTIRIILALGAIYDWELENMDVVTAFLQSEMQEEVYVRQPEGYEKFGPNGEPLVCKLHKSLYGLKQSPRNWNQVVDKWFKTYGLIPSKSDPCLYVKRKDGDILIVVLYVDDLIIAGNNRALVDQFKLAMANRFQMKDIGALKWILGMEVIRDRKQRTLQIKQTAYIDQMIVRFRMEDCYPLVIPCTGNNRRLHVKPEKPNKLYMSIVGSLMYASITSRPDIAYAVQELYRHMQAPGPEHLNAAKRVLRYLKGTRELGIQYSGQGSQGAQLVSYVDADYGGDLDTGRSTTAYIFQLGGGSISWTSRLQPSTADSSTNSEYIASAEAAKEACYLRPLMECLGFQQKLPITMYEDNQACIALSKHHAYHRRTKHIALRWHFIREKVEEGIVKLVYISTKAQIADLLTKPLTRDVFERFRSSILGM